MTKHAQPPAPSPEQESWKPQIGDWFILKASYCGEGEGCTSDNPCSECLKICNRFVITADHCSQDFFFGGGWCTRGNGHVLDETYSAVLTFDASKQDGLKCIHHVSEAIFIGRSYPEQAADFAKERAEDKERIRYFESCALHTDRDETIIIAEIGKLRTALAAMEEKVRHEKKIAHDARQMEAEKTNALLIAEQRITSLEEKVREAETKLNYHYDRADTNGQDLVNADRDLDDLRAQLASTQAKLEEAEKEIADSLHQNTKTRAAILAPANCGVPGHFRFQENGGHCMMCQKDHRITNESLTLAAALKQAREALEEWNRVYRETDSEYDECNAAAQMADAALSTHPDSALLGRIRTALGQAVDSARARHGEFQEGSPADQWEKLLADLGGQS